MRKRSGFGRADLLLGLVLAALGVYTFLNPQLALPGLIFFFSLLAILTGLTDIVFYVRLKSHTGFGPTASLVAGIFCVLAGCMLLLNPLLGRWIFHIVFPVWFIAHGVSRLANYRRIRALAGRGASGASLALNALSILLGVVMTFVPAVSSLSLGYLVAAALVLHGAGSVAESFSRLGEAECPGHTEPGRR